jgi:hypothetical protein
LEKVAQTRIMKATLAVLIAALPVIAADVKTITVSAGDYDRRNTVVTFRGEFARGRDLELSTKGKTFPLQVNDDGTASFVLDELAKGKELTLRAGSGVMAATRLDAKRDKTKVKLGRGAEAWLEYQAEPSELPRDNVKPIFQRGAYLHPIRTLGGKVITDDYPPNHIHHHGIWWAWTKTEFDGRAPDFWNMGEGKAKVDFVSLQGTWGGPVHCGFVGKHQFTDLTGGSPAAALNETWDVRVYNNARNNIWVFDLTSTQECATDKPLKLPEYHYGGLGFRGHWDWNGKTNVNFLTSEGITDRVKGHATRAKWCDMSGWREGKQAGIAILCHPENFRAPQHMRLHPSEPFFCYAPQQGGDMEIAPGKKYVSRYRFVVHDGPPNKEVIDRLWNDYAYPPVVKVE